MWSHSRSPALLAPGEQPRDASKFSHNHEERSRIRYIIIPLHTHRAARVDRLGRDRQSGQVLFLRACQSFGLWVHRAHLDDDTTGSRRQQVIGQSGQHDDDSQ